MATEIFIGLLVLICIYIVYTSMYVGTEKYRSCNDCDTHQLQKNGDVVINPYVFPYSATDCMTNIYSSYPISSNLTEPVHVSTPDHVLLTQ